MGNREDLLAGAKRCLLEKGYSNTTARDIAAASGVSLAAIGYHFGSKDALMNEAMFQAMGEWGDELEKAFREAGPELDAAQRFQRVWDDVIGTFDDNSALWRASIELLLLADRIPGGHEALAAAIPMARSGMTALFLGVDEDTIDDDTARSVGGIYYSLMAGMLIQRFADPDSAPNGRDLAKGLRMIAASLEASESSAV
jgi:AcrR family transcriptional regulator